MQQTAVTTLRIGVGVLFLLSGLVKANDPLGLAYKMQEFFDVWNAGMEASSFVAKNVVIAFFQFLHGQALLLSLVMITLEIVAGVALLIGWQKKAVLWLLLLLIVFFTFLTGYAFASGKFKNCGCFGDCLPITPLASLLKDVGLLLAILALFFNQRYMQPVGSRGFRAAAMITTLLATVGLQWYVLQYLPLADCLPFKQGASIPQGMKIPANAVPDSFAIRFVYKKDGRQFQFSPDNLPADLEAYEYIDRTDKLIRKGNAEPPIKGFALSGITTADSTAIVLAQPKAILYFIDGQDALSQKEKETFLKVYQAATKKAIPVYGVTNGLENVLLSFSESAAPAMSFFKIDFTTFKTAARANPTIYLLQHGTVINKWGGSHHAKAIAAIQRL